MELDIAGLNTAGRDELLEHWRSLIGRPPPKHISRSLADPDISLRAANEAVWRLLQKAEPAPHPRQPARCYAPRL